MPSKRLVWYLFPQIVTLLAGSLALIGLISRFVTGTAARWLVGTPLVLGLSLLVSWLVGRSIGHSLQRLKEAAQRFSVGDFADRLREADHREMEEAADAFNAMAEHLEGTIRSLKRRNNEQEAVLTSMVEGVLAVDSDQRVISINAAAARLLGAQPEEVEGRGLQEVIRNADLRRFVTNALTYDQPVEGNLIMRNERDRVLQLNGTALRDPSSRVIGAVVVLNDVSRLRQLENLRRDFAANVSHELRTPITSIKGFTETLLDGALANPHDADRFLRIIARQADRLNTIIEDLLSLSRIEKEAEHGDISLSVGRIEKVLQAAMQDCAARAAQRQIEVVMECPSDLAARMKADLLEQAVINLLDNAIKFSEPGRQVWLTGCRENHLATIAVKDQGSGIAEEHHSRLFERFYRVDKARSRNLGGTGLGLAIVKHIALAHRGQVAVESALGQGSTFFIRLPAA
ncbi:MAG TPA: ATP-binding protein [Pirellulales bacterium]|nr:ATP-binding protein [Pirellulales bacterium]